MGHQNIVEPWLTTKLVYSLGDFVASSIAQAREKAEHFTRNWCSCMFTEDDGGQVRRGHLEKV